MCGAVPRREPRIRFTAGLVGVGGRGELTPSWSEGGAGGGGAICSPGSETPRLLCRAL